MYNEQQDVGGFIYIYIYFFLQWAFKSFKLPQGGGFVCFFLFLLRPSNLIVRIRLQTHVFKRLLIISNNEKTRTYRLTSADVPCLLSQPMHARSTCCRCTQKQKNKQMLFVVGPSSSSLSLLFLHDFFFCPPRRNKLCGPEEKKGGKCRITINHWIKESDKSYLVWSAVEGFMWFYLSLSSEQRKSFFVLTLFGHIKVADFYCVPSYSVTKSILLATGKFPQWLQSLTILHHCIMKRRAQLELHVLFNRDVTGGDCMTAAEL